MQYGSKRSIIEGSERKLGEGHWKGLYTTIHNSKSRMNEIPIVKFSLVLNYLGYKQSLYTLTNSDLTFLAFVLLIMVGIPYATSDKY